MTRRILALTLGAMLGVCLVSALPPAAAQVREFHEAPDTKPAAAEADIPVRAVVLFSSGVGYFEHFGAVTGDGTTEFSSAAPN
jgi:hypothetical protein